MDIPIIFSGLMVEALLEGRKTMTRRLLRAQPPFTVTGCANANMGGRNAWWDVSGADGRARRVRCPYATDDILFVRETFRLPIEYDAVKLVDVPPDVAIYFPGGGVGKLETPAGFGRARPSIHLPKRWSRIRLRVTATRAEHLWAIDAADVRSEGIQRIAGDYVVGDFSGDAVGAFHHLWTTLHGPLSWRADPAVWVVSFERAEGAPRG